MDRRSFLLGAAGLATAAFATTEAEAALPVFLGRRKVDPFLDRDRIQVGAGAGLFRKIQFRVTGNDAYIFDVNVRYSNGGFDDIPTRFQIPQGGYSRKIDLRNNRRHIRYVSFFYGKLRNGRGATYVELWGWR